MKRNYLVLLGVIAVLVVAVALGVRSMLSRPDRVNVLLITLDTTRADHLGCYGYEPALTPNLDALAAGGVLFEQAFCTAPLTLPSHTTIFTGLQPPEHGLRVNAGGRLDPGIPTLAETLKRQGYRTGAFIAAFVLHSKFGLNKGFDVYDDSMTGAYEQQIADPLRLYRAGNWVTDSALAWLEKQANKPFFCWVHLFDPHTPYYPHSELDGTKFQGQESYDAEIAFMDIQVGRLREFLVKRGLSERTLVIAVGDHGEGLGEHGEPVHGMMLYDATMRVPLVFQMPGKLPAKHRVTNTVSLVDLSATIKDMLGVSDTQAPSGQSWKAALMGGRIDSVACYGETNQPYADFAWCPLRSLTTEKWKYIRTARAELYDRTADPGELNNLAAAQPERLAQMEAELKRTQAAMTRRVAEKVALTSEQRRRLQDLGYVGGQLDADADNLDISKLKDVKDMVSVLRMSLPFEIKKATTFQEMYLQNVALCRELVRLVPDSAQYRASLGQALQLTGQLEEAIAQYRKSLELKPDQEVTLYNLGVALVRRGEPGEAIEHFRAALRLKPDDSATHNSLANALAQQGATEEARKHYQEALRLDPNCAGAHCGLGKLLADQGQLDQALEHLTRAARLDPEEAVPNYELGVVLAKHNKLDEAGAYLATAARLRPDWPEASLRLAEVLERQGRTERAAAVRARLQRATASGPVPASQKSPFPTAQDHYRLAQALAAQGRMAEAITHYEQALGLRPDWVAPLNALAWFKATHPDPKVRDPAQAVSLAERACDLTGRKDPATLDTLAAAYAAAGRFPEALRVAQQVVDLAVSSNQPQAAELARARLQLYQAGKPYREQPSQPARPAPRETPRTAPATASPR